MWKVLAGLGIAAGAGGLAYGGFQVLKVRNDMMMAQMQAMAMAPVAARPTQQGQDLAGAVASIFDGGAQLMNTAAPLISLFMK